MSCSVARSLSLSAIALVSMVGLSLSCGSAQRSTTPKAASLAERGPSNAVGSLLVVPTISATMMLVDSGVASDIGDYLGLGDALHELAADAEDQDDPVQVSFRLGPKMASRTFAIGLNGEVSPDDAKKLRRMFRCRRSGRSRRMNRGLYAKLADLAQHYQGHTIEVVSAYRHGRNAKPTSRHRQGRAIDIKVVGIPAAQVRDYLWARYEDEVGVGFYKEQQFVHLDHRHNYPATAWTQKHHSGENEYNPSWSRSSRRSKLVVALAGASE